MAPGDGVSPTAALFVEVALWEQAFALLDHVHEGRSRQWLASYVAQLLLPLL